MIYQFLRNAWVEKTRKAVSPVSADGNEIGIHSLCKIEDAGFGLLIIIYCVRNVHCIVLLAELLDAPCKLLAVYIGSVHIKQMNV